MSPLLLAVEHRAAPPIEALALELHAHEGALALRIVEGSVVAEPVPHEPSASDRVEQALAAFDEPVTRRELRAACRIRMATLCQALNELVADGRVLERGGRYRLLPT